MQGDSVELDSLEELILCSSLVSPDSGEILTRFGLLHSGLGSVEEELGHYSYV